MSLPGQVSKNEGIIFYVCFAYVLLDTFWNYHLNNLFGITLPVNALLPILYLFGLVLHRNIITMLPGPGVLWSLFMLFTSLSIGGFIASGELIPSFMKNASMIVSFLVGYTCLRNCTNDNSFFITLALVSVTYVITCILAISQTAPSIFPVQGGMKILGGELVRRYEITTDQNFQILYCIGTTALLFAATRPLHIVALILFTFLNLYIVSEIQTRSGFIVVVLVVLVIAVVRIRQLDSARGRLYLVAGLALTVVFTILQADKLGDIFQNIILRFTDSDFDTLSARTEGVLLFFRFLVDPVRWLPLKPMYFFDANGFDPHFSPAVIIMRGGLIAVLCWIYLLLWPLATILFRTVVQLRSTRLSGVVAVSAMAAALVFMAAPIYAWDVVWLWGGAVVGCLSCEKSGEGVEAGRPSESTVLHGRTSVK